MMETTRNKSTFSILESYCISKKLALFHLSQKGKILNISSNTYPLLGVNSTNHLIGRNILDILSLFNINHDLAINIKGNLIKDGNNTLFQLTPSLEENGDNVYYLSIDIKLSMEEHVFCPNLTDQIPYPIFCKDIDGQYIWSNKSLDEYAGQSVLGLTDYELPWGKIAKPLISNDKHVLEKNETLATVEESINKYGNKQLAYSIKVPVFNPKTDVVIGSMGMSIFTCHQVIGLNHQNNNNTSSGLHLSPREIECVKLLSKGLGAMEIAKNLGLSKRTIEKYIENIKNKTNSSNLIQLGFKLGKLYSHLFDSN